jgi:hypothetical protein
MLQDELFLVEHGRPEIDYGLIAQAISFYKSKGFKYIEVPWVIPKEYNELTFPGPFPFTTDYGVLIGSAEQAFIYLATMNKLAWDRPYFAVSPCFRDDRVDATHQKSFLKVELFLLGWSQHFILTIAKEFYESIGLITETIVTEQGFDLCSKGIELGSYGERQYKNIKWTYGTGLAEPRTSLVRMQ